jgi:hypothetical protein
LQADCVSNDYMFKEDANILAQNDDPTSKEDIFSAQGQELDDKSNLFMTQPKIGFNN